MSIKVPDRWVLVKFENEESKTVRVLGSWYGGYATGDSWQMNSGITEYHDCGTHYDFVGFSGSVYRCYKGQEGMSSLAQSILNYFIYQASLPENKSGVTVMLVDNVDDNILPRG
jgi:hypothetical protein